MVIIYFKNTEGVGIQLTYWSMRFLLSLVNRQIFCLSHVYFQLVIWFLYILIACGYDLRDHQLKYKYR